MSLCQTFRDLSYQTWMQLAKARKVDHQILEESVTDSLLVELKYKHPYEIYTKTFTKIEESLNGADWEWWFVNSSGDKGIGFRVQAKIIHFKSNSFKQLNYKSKNSVLSQTDNLINNALNSNIPLIPIYCLYLHHDDFFDDLNSLSSFVKCLLNYCSKEHFGCSILSAYQVNQLKLKNKNHINDLKYYLHPWHSLVCNSYGFSHSLSLPEKTWEFVKRANICDEIGKEQFDLPNNGQLPEYVKDILDMREKFSNEDKNESFNGLRGIVILKEN